MPRATLVRRPEGPFGEWTGYYASNQPAVPVIQIKAVYFRHDPILCGFPLLKPSSGDNLHFSLMRSAMIWNALDETGVPDVKGVWCHPSGGRFLTVISIKQRYPGHAKQAGMIASQCRSGAYLGRYVVVVDEDVDITNSEEFLWALSSRSDPAQSIDIQRRAWSGPLDPRIPRDEVGQSSRAVIDATRPYEWREKFPKVSGHSAELKDKVRKNGRSFWRRKRNRVGHEKAYSCFFVVDSCLVIRGKPRIRPNVATKGNPQLFEQRDYFHRVFYRQGKSKEYLILDSQILKLPQPVAPPSVFDFTIQREVNKDLEIR